MWEPIDYTSRTPSAAPPGHGRRLLRPQVLLVGLLVVVVGVPLLLLSCTGGQEVVRFEERITFRVPPTVRVALAVRTRGGVTQGVRVSGLYTIIDPATHAEITRGSNLRKSPVLALNDGLVLDVKGRRRTCQRVRIVPAKDGTLYVGHRAYRGTLDIVYNRDDGTMTLVNVLSIESYLRGVLAAEMPASWPEAALRTQAVAARTYTLALIMENDRKDPRPEYDFEAGYAKSQQYIGVAGERHARAVEAVNATHGMVLVHDGRVFRTYYHSASGGHTEACGLVWDDYKTIPPLVGRPDEYSRRSKHQEWTVRLKRRDIEDALRKRGRDVGTIHDLRFYDSNANGHHDHVLVTGTRGSVRMGGNDFRLAVGSMKLKSTNFTFKRDGDAFRFDGHGFGHGVGMSQYGAMNMAQELFNYDDILLFYYPGSELWKVYD